MERHQDAVDAATLPALIRAARRELGLPEQASAAQVSTVAALAERIGPHLPTNARVETMADVFGELRQRATTELGTEAAALRWDSNWTDFANPAFGRCVGLDDPDVRGFVSDVLCRYDGDFNAPNELVGETVRCIWKAQGGEPFWEEPCYEEDWCASQGVFRDLVRMPLFLRAARLHADREWDRAPVEPQTELESVIPRRRHCDLLQSIEIRFGVWVGRRPREGCLPVLVAGTLASPLGLRIPMCILIELFGRGEAPFEGALGIWACLWGVAIWLYIRSQPRLPPEVRTVKDLVRTIIRKRRQTTPRPRVRPVTAPSGRAGHLAEMAPHARPGSG